MPPAQPPGQGQNPKDIAEAQAAMMNARTNQAKQQSEAQNKQLEIATNAQTELKTHAMTLQADMVNGNADRVAANRQAQAETAQADAQESGQLQAIMSAVNQLSQQVATIMKAISPAGTA
jgi:hypothetical protein